MNGALYVEDSENRKLAGSRRVDATYVAMRSTCPSTCTLAEVGCYAKAAKVGILVRRLEREAGDQNAIATARAEAAAIDGAHGGGGIPYKRDLRLHVSGDGRTEKGSRIVNAAIERWRARGGGVAWGYTHAWRAVPRAAWSAVSMLASCETVSEASEASAAGYATAIAVPSFEGMPRGFIACPAQSTEGRMACTDCRLCLDDARLRDRGLTIAFEAHGYARARVRRHLTVLQKGDRHACAV